VGLELLEDFTTSLDRIRTVTFDLPGIGGSDPLWMPRRASGLARLARDLLLALDEPVVDVLGVSWGGMLAQQLAVQYPSLCRRLVLAATSTGQLMIPANPLALFEPMALLRLSSAGGLRRVAASIYGVDLRRDPEIIERYPELVALPRLIGYAHQLWALGGWTSFFWLERIRQPTLVLAGLADPIVPRANAEILASRIPSATLRWFDCGHLFLLTRRDEVARAVTDFLTSEWPAGAQASRSTPSSAERKTRQPR
jgi:poly(3-hydroxyalkanoate) depolymerase